MRTFASSLKIILLLYIEKLNISLFKYMYIETKYFFISLFVNVSSFLENGGIDNKVL